MQAQALRAYTFDDLAHMPDDGQRYEVIDGALVVTPAPGGPHQNIVGRLFAQLDRACPPQFVVLPGAQLRLADNQAPIPDLLVVRASDPLPAEFGPHDVVLVAEVTSPRQSNRDLVTKLAVYGEAGVPVYLVADRGELHVFSDPSASGNYTTSQRGATVTLESPFALTLTHP